MLRDKILFVVKRKFHSAILHKEMKTSKCGKLIQMTTGYFLRWRTSCHSFPGHPLSKIAAAGSNSLQTRASLSLIPVGCPPPPSPHPILGQTIDRCSLLRRFLWSFSFLSLARIKHRRLLSSTKNRLTIAISFAILEQSRVILSQAGWARYIVICINPAFSKMIHGTENPKSLLNLQNAQCDTTNFALKGTSTTAKCDSTFPWVYPSVTVRYDFFLRLDNVRESVSVRTEAQCPVIPPVELILLFKLNSLSDCSDGCWDNFPGKHPPSLIRPWCMSECPSLEYCWPTTTDRMKLSCG